MNTNIIARPQVEIDEAVKLLMQEEYEKCTILHCSFSNTEDSGMRIWPSTFLIEQNGKKHKLIKAFNISLMPVWTFYPKGETTVKFTLVFEGLTKSCSSFTMLEEIPEPGGFFTNEIARNKTDVYITEIFC